MNEELHRAVMALDDEAQLLDLAGKHEAAREKLEQAAELEERCADAIGVGEPRSRGILRVSAVSLWMQAGRLDRAESAARRYLAEALLPGFHRELSDLLARIAECRAESATVVEEPDERTPELTATLRKVEEGFANRRVPLRRIQPAA
jgi:hypothetical protein